MTMADVTELACNGSHTSHIVVISTDSTSWICSAASWVKGHKVSEAISSLLRISDKISTNGSTFPTEKITGICHGCSKFRISSVFAKNLVLVTKFKFLDYNFSTANKLGERSLVKLRLYVV